MTISKEQINDIKRCEIANVIVLHDFYGSNVKLESWIDFVETFLINYNISANRIGITGANFSGRSNIIYKNGKKKLEKVNYEGVDSVWIGATPPNHKNDIFDSICAASISTDKINNSTYLLLDDNITGFKREDYSKITSRLLELTGAKYGYIYQRPFKMGPSWYPLGIIGNKGYSEYEEDMIMKWSDVYHMPDGNYKTGDLRDIYEGNIIRDEHLRRDVGGQSLKDWIEKDAANGEIEDLGGGRYIWWVDTDKIEHVRLAIKDSGIILCI